MFAAKKINKKIDLMKKNPNKHKRIIITGIAIRAILLLSMYGLLDLLKKKGHVAPK
tara:strand:+ start:192 stop:359 length:168 start_codon:yes stop_codon:yes gene_type:complete